MMRHVIDLFELSAGEIERIFAITEDLKAKWATGVREPLLPGRVMALRRDLNALWIPSAAGFGGFAYVIG